MIRTDIMNEALLVEKRDQWFGKLQQMFDGTYRDFLSECGSA